MINRDPICSRNRIHIAWPSCARILVYIGIVIRAIEGGKARELTMYGSYSELHAGDVVSARLTRSVRQLEKAML